MFRKISSLLIRLLLIIGVSGGLLLGLSWVFMELSTRSQLYTKETAPQAPVAIVFGAGLLRDGSPTPVLRDRIATAADLYFGGKVQKLLMSGDNRFVTYNEPGAMKAYAIRLGVPTDDIVTDYAGRRTYDTCYRARAIFGVGEAVLVTQRYHLPRAVYTCNMLGMKAGGVIADRRVYHRFAYWRWKARETAATAVALWELWFAHPVPVLGEPEPIFTGISQTAPP